MQTKNYLTPKELVNIAKQCRTNMTQQEATGEFIARLCGMLEGKGFHYEASEIAFDLKMPHLTDRPN